MKREPARFGDDGKLKHVLVMMAAVIVVYSVLGWVVYDGYIRR